MLTVGARARRDEDDHRDGDHAMERELDDKEEPSCQQWKECGKEKQLEEREAAWRAWRRARRAHATDPWVEYAARSAHEAEHWISVVGGEDRHVSRGACKKKRRSSEALDTRRAAVCCVRTSCSVRSRMRETSFGGRNVCVDRLRHTNASRPTATFWFRSRAPNLFLSHSLRLLAPRLRRPPALLEPLLDAVGRSL